MPEITENLEEMKEQFDRLVWNQFLVFGNINDHLPLGCEYASLKTHLISWLKFMDILVFFDIAGGLQFPFKSHEKLFREITGFVKPKPEINKKELERLSPNERKELEKAIQELEDKPEPPLPTSPCEAIMLIEQVVNQSVTKKPDKKARLACIIEHAETIAPAEIGSQSESDRINLVALRRLSDKEISGESLVVLIAQDLGAIHSSLRERGSRVKVIEIPLPNEKERFAFIRKLCLNKECFQEKITSQEFAHNTGGLSLAEIANISKQSDVITVERVSQEKSRYLEHQFGDILKIMEPRWGLDRGIGGLAEIKAYCGELKPALISGDPRLVPPAIILMGPPGTGKTALAEALAWEIQVPFVEILNLRSMWVGESEKNTLRVMSALQALSPCVIFWDEFDQEETPRGSYQGDSGVSSRLRKIRFQITSDPKNRGKFLVIYATNRVDLVDQADKRSGRASVRIPMLMPDEDDQSSIFEVMPGRYDFHTAVLSFKALVKTLRDLHGEYISGADIEEISLSAFRHSAAQKHEKVTNDDYLWAINDFVPHHYGKTTIRAMEELAVKERSSNRFLQKRGHDILKIIKALPKA